MAKKKVTKKKVTKKKVTKKKVAKKVAKKTTARAASRSVVGKKQDERTRKKLVGMGEGVVKSSLAMRDPFVDIPSRTVSNTKFNKRKRILEMGENTQRRNLFNLSQARKFMQTVLLAESSKVTIEAHLVSTPQGGEQPSLEFEFAAVQRTEKDVTPISTPSSVATAAKSASSTDPK